MMDWRLICGRAQDVLGQYAGQIDLVVTSPPYDDMRAFGGYMDAWDFDAVADAIIPALKDGGVIVWNVGDAVIDGSESGTSFRHALGWMSRGLRLHQTLIYTRLHSKITGPTRYLSTTQYLFVLSNGAPKTFNPICDRPNIGVGWRSKWQPGRDGDQKPLPTGHANVEPYGKRNNVWAYPTGWNHMGKPNEDQAAIHDHPAVFPYALAADLIRSYSDPGDVVCDPMAGSGTTIRAAVDLHRRALGIEVNPEYCAAIRKRMAQGVLL